MNKSNRKGADFLIGHQTCFPDKIDDEIALLLFRTGYPWQFPELLKITVEQFRRLFGDFPWIRTRYQFPLSGDLSISTFRQTSLVKVKGKKQPLMRKRCPELLPAEGHLDAVGQVLYPQMLCS